MTQLHPDDAKYFVVTFTLCAFFALLVVTGIAIYVYKRHMYARDKFRLANVDPAAGAEAGATTGDSSKDYQVINTSRYAFVCARNVIVIIETYNSRRCIWSLVCDVYVYCCCCVCTQTLYRIDCQLSSHWPGEAVTALDCDLHPLCAVARF